MVGKESKKLAYLWHIFFHESNKPIKYVSFKQNVKWQIY